MEIKNIIDKEIKITEPSIREHRYCNKDGMLAMANVIDYGESHLIYGGMDLGTIEDIAIMAQQLYWYKREYRYLLKLCFGEIKTKKTKALTKKYTEDLKELNKWFSQEQQIYNERRILEHD